MTMIIEHVEDKILSKVVMGTGTDNEVAVTYESIDEGDFLDFLGTFLSLTNTKVA